jgi:hypothetical protein
MTRAVAAALSAVLRVNAAAPDPFLAAALPTSTADTTVTDPYRRWYGMYVTLADDEVVGDTKSSSPGSPPCSTV